MHSEVEPAAGHQEEGEDTQGQTEGPVVLLTDEDEERERQSYCHHGMSGRHPVLIIPAELHPHCRWHPRSGPSQNIL